MKRPHLLRVEEGPEVFATLLAAVRRAGLRAGWLELAAAGPGPLPPGLAGAAEAGVLRAVAVGPGGSVAVKPRAGEPVLDDLLREHFLGCRLVLVKAVQGGPEEVQAAPSLSPAGEGTWRVEVPGEAARSLPTEQLAARLRRPRPWPLAE